MFKKSATFKKRKKYAHFLKKYDIIKGNKLSDKKLNQLSQYVKVKW